MSNTTQTASPRRNTAAPAGLAQLKLNRTWALTTRLSMWTTPPAGSGLGRAGVTLAGWAAASSAGVGGGFLKTLTNAAPSADPTLASASSLRVSTSCRRPPTCFFSAVLIQRGGEVCRRAMSGSPSRGKVRVRVWPSRRAWTLAAPRNSRREKVSAWATRTSTPPPAGAAPAGSTAPAIAAATTPALRVWRSPIG